MSDVKLAVRTAAQFLANVLEEDGIRDIRLEEVELKENESGLPAWRVTFSFLRNRGDSESPWSESLRPFMQKSEREVKVVEVDLRGNAVGMKQWLAN
jgi:hypothetical protein